MINKLALELKEAKKHVKFYGVNIDKIFLYNEEMQKILVDKINVQFLRDSSFSNVENLFSTRYVRNI